MLTIVVRPAKHSAGFLILSGARVLLLRRAPQVRNGDTWGLPGGQIDRREAAYAAAVRESVEELAGLPAHAIVGAAAVQRGARRYEVFACRAPRRLRRDWSPRLNHEHVDFIWADWRWLFQRRANLHPVLGALLGARDGRRWLERMLMTPDAEHLPGGRRLSDGVRPACA
ncbi:MAG: NUDIX hydrolase [Myxococcales bacterium]|nr:NUDIX hydrolase [Myxococcales bacterium]